MLQTEELDIEQENTDEWVNQYSKKAHLDKAKAK